MSKENPKKRPDKALIDKMVDWRRYNRPNDETPIKVNLTSEVMHNALRLPRPAEGEQYPQSCLYRGFRIEATKPNPQPKAMPGEKKKLAPTREPVEERRPYNDD